MDEYQASVESVDAALKRLNATLASYKIQDASATQGKGKSASAQDSQTKTAKFAPPPVDDDDDLMDPPVVKERSLDEDPVWQELLSLRSTQPIPKITKEELPSSLASVRSIHAHIANRPHCIPLYILQSQRYLALGYPDLAAGAAYKALFLSDAVQDYSDEYHDDACEALHQMIQFLPLVERISLLKTELNADSGSRLARAADGEGERADIEVAVWLREHYLPLVYRILIRSTYLCGSYRSAAGFMVRALSLYPNNTDIQAVRKDLERALAQQSTEANVSATQFSRLTNWPEQGYVRRELYPWNDLEPTRSLDEIRQINLIYLSQMAPKLEARRVQLPNLADSGEAAVTQLGLFAKEDIAPGEVILDESSLLTANNKLHDAMCDACSADLDPAEMSTTVQCPDCEAVFCSGKCYDKAMEWYHPALCGTDAETSAKDVPPAEAADSLYALLLLRVIAMAETCNGISPLEFRETRFTWGDFHGLPIEKHWQPPSFTSPSEAFAGFPRTLPFSFEHNIRLPLHMMDKMGLDIFSNTRFDTWVLNTLYAKFRGTASARLSGLGGRAVRGPEVSAVHPMWCLANHSCDPNVSWEWGGSIKFWARKERVVWKGRGGKEYNSPVGIKKGEEILNHYCDVELPVQERREWARGALGGDCMCQRCLWEAKQEGSG